DAPQQSSLKPDTNRNISSSDQQKYFGGDENVGDTLNKIADPGWVDTSKKMRTVGKSELGKDAFMTLLLTQMKNQDPTNPLKSHEMAAQLAQFTSLEKLTNINEAVDGLRKDGKAQDNFQALGFLGKTIMTDNSAVSHAEAEESHVIRFTLPQDAPKVTMQIK